MANASRRIGRPFRDKKNTRTSKRTRIAPMEAQVNAASHQNKWSPAPDAGELVQRIHAMLHPRNIVLVGATDKPGNYAERIWNNLIKYKFGGGLYPVNAQRDTVWGVTCYKDFARLPEHVD